MAYTSYSVPSNYTDGVDLDAGGYLAKGKPLARSAAVLYEGEENDTAALSGKYAKNLYSYGYTGDPCYYIIPGIVKAWGLENSELAGLYTYDTLARRGDAIRFADQRYSTTPLSRGSDAPAGLFYACSTPFEVVSWQLGNASDSYSTVYVAWNGSDEDPRCYWSSSSSPLSSSSSSYVSGYGVWVFIQAAGGGGAECYTGQSSSSTPAGSGGGGGACALVYLNCKKASSGRGSRAYDFFISIGKPGAAGTEYAVNVPGGVGGDAADTTLWQSTVNTIVKKILVVGGGGGGRNSASASTCLGGDGGLVYVGDSSSPVSDVWDAVDTDEVWVPFVYLGQRGGQTYATAYYNNTAGDIGGDMPYSALEFQLTGDFFLKRNKQSDVTGAVMWGKGASAIYQYGTSIYYAGGGGASACACMSYAGSYVQGSAAAYKSFGWVPAACSTGHGGNGGNGFQQPTAGGRGCVFFLKSYSMAGDGTPVEYTNPELAGSYDRGDWAVTVTNSNDFEVMCYYSCSTSSSPEWSSLQLSAGQYATIASGSDLDGYTVRAYFIKPGASARSDITEHTLDSSSSTSWSEPD